MDLIKFHYVASVLDMLNHIKQSLNFFPQTCGVQSFSLVILYANYLYFALPDVKQACVKSCSGYIYVFFVVAAFHMFAATVCQSPPIVQRQFSFTTKSLRWFFFSFLPFSGTSWKLISLSGMPLHHYESKSHIWFQCVASVISPQGTAIGNIVFIMAHFVFTSVLWWLCLWLLK